MDEGRLIDFARERRLIGNSIIFVHGNVFEGLIQATVVRYE